MALQLLAYAIGVMQEFHVARVDAFAFAPHGPAEWKFSLERTDLDRFVELAEDLAARTTREIADRKPLDLRSGRHCQYCPALATCPTATEIAVCARRGRLGPDADPRRKRRVPNRRRSTARAEMGRGEGGREFHREVQEGRWGSSRGQRIRLPRAT